MQQRHVSKTLLTVFTACLIGGTSAAAQAESSAAQLQREFNSKQLGTAPRAAGTSRNAAPVVIQGAPPLLAADGGGTVVEGFADKVPLSVAMQQVLPQGYSYTLGDGVDPGQLVSWRGGRPWTTVMQEMLGGAGLAAAANGRSVAVSYAGRSPTIIAGGQPQPMPSAMTPPAQPYAPQPMAQQPMAQQPMGQPPMALQPQPVAPAGAPPAYMPGPQPPAYGQAPGQAPLMPAPVAQQPMLAPVPQGMPSQAMQPQPLPPQGMPPQAMAPQPLAPVPVAQPQDMQPQPMPPQPMPPQAMTQPAPQDAASAGPQPLQIQNPLIYTPMTWEARPGQTLRAILQEWCGRAGVELNWAAEFDYPVMASLNITGTFEEAVRTLLAGFDDAKPTPRGRLHFNPAAGQSILVVEAKGNHYGE